MTRPIGVHLYNLFGAGRVHVGGLDRKLHTIDADTGRGIWTFTATGGFVSCPRVLGGVGNTD